MFLSESYMLVMSLNCDSTLICSLQQLILVYVLAEISKISSILLDAYLYGLDSSQGFEFFCAVKIA